MTQGIEPSVWLQRKAQERNLPVHLGIFPHPAAAGPFDVITLVDVLEHVATPVELLRSIHGSLSEKGLALVVTPDRASILARTLGWKWWHYRIAHIGYFDRRTLTLALRNAGLEPLAWSRPSWFFPANYLIARLNHYLPKSLPLPTPAFARNLVVRLNPLDSIACLCRKQR